MLATVTGNARAQGGEIPPPRVRTTYFSDANRYLAIGLAGHQVLTYTVACLILLIFVVIVPAVWSTGETRRAAAQEVLDKLLHFMRPRR